MCYIFFFNDLKKIRGDYLIIIKNNICVRVNVLKQPLNISYRAIRVVFIVSVRTAATNYPTASAILFVRPTTFLLRYGQLNMRHKVHKLSANRNNGRVRHNVRLECRLRLRNKRIHLCRPRCNIILDLVNIRNHRCLRWTVHWVWTIST